MVELKVFNIEETTHRELNGREYLVSPTTFIKAQYLDQGYVPAEEIRKSQRAWNGTPLTLNHPHNAEGDLVSANNPEMVEKTELGRLFNTDLSDDGQSLEGEVWIDKDRAESIGGEAKEIVDRLDNGDPVSVSTSYFGDRLDPGEYDGEYREQVMGNLRPDHLALLPNKAGRCSIDDGCMAGSLAANGLQIAMNKSVAGVSFEGTKGGKLDKSKIDTDEHTLSDHYLFGSGDVKGDYSYPVVDADGFLRKGNVESAFKVGASGEGVTESELHSKLRKLNDEFDSPPIDGEKLSGNADDPGNSGEDGDASETAGTPDSDGADDGEQSVNVLRAALSSIMDSFNFGGSDRPRDSTGKFIEKDVDIDSLHDGDVVSVVKDSGESSSAVYQSTEDGHVVIGDDNTRRIASDSIGRIDVIERFSGNMTERERQIEFLVENHGFKEDSLAGMGDTCLERTYESFNEDDDGEEQVTNSDSGGLSAESVREIVREESVTQDALEEKVDEKIASNAERREKQGLIDTIVANSEFEEEELVGNDKPTLKKMKQNVTEQATNYAAQLGGSSGVSSDDVDDFPSLSAGARMKEMGGDD